MPFSELGLRPDFLRAIEARGYKHPTPIQSQAVPVVLEGRDVLAGAQTGTGKTAAFALPILQLFDENPRRSAHKSKAPRGLVLTPTRELAAQVGHSIDTYGAHLNLRSTVVFGGVNINPQKDRLRRGVDILVATPGRLLDHAGQNTVDLSAIEILVLDEADRMLDMGFIHDIRRVLALLPARRQNLLFSATYSPEIKHLADNLLHRPARIEVARANPAADTVTQYVYRVNRKIKRDLLIHLINEEQWTQVLIFTRTKHGANRLADQLARAGIEAAAIHGNKSQNARTMALARFKNGRVRALVATDIAARGLDINRLPHVVNYEMPNVPEDYVHRIGRTGRAGEEGIALSFVDAEENKLLADIERLLKRRIPELPVPAVERVAAADSSEQRPSTSANDADRRAASSRSKPSSNNSHRNKKQPQGQPNQSGPGRSADRRRRRRKQK